MFYVLPFFFTVASTSDKITTLIPNTYFPSNVDQLNSCTKSNDDSFAVCPLIMSDNSRVFAYGSSNPNVFSFDVRRQIPRSEVYPVLNPLTPIESDQHELGRHWFFLLHHFVG
jgi:hypothetical protein